MQIENWSVSQTESNVNVTLNLTSFDDFDSTGFIKYIKEFGDTDIDMSEYKELKSAKEADIKMHDHFRGLNHAQIVCVCDELYEKLQKNPKNVYNRKLLKVGIGILQDYDVFWCPPVDKYDGEQNKQSDDPYKDLPYEGKMVGSVFRRPADE